VEHELLHESLVGRSYLGLDLLKLWHKVLVLTEPLGLSKFERAFDNAVLAFRF
jgi:hypothetical protein